MHQERAGLGLDCGAGRIARFERRRAESHRSAQTLHRGFLDLG
jgi:hypothetical protein